MLDAQQSEVFASVTEGNVAADLSLSLTIDNTGNTAVAGITGFLSGLTLFAFPGYAKDVYTLQTVVTRDGVVVNEGTYTESMTSIFQWVMIVFMPTNSINGCEYGV